MDVATVPRQDPTLATRFDSSYTEQRDRVDAAYRRMREVEFAAHPPAQARQAAEELVAALAAAAGTVAHRLEPTTQAETVPIWRRLGRRKAVRTVPRSVQAWLTEFVRLAEIGVWLRRVTADEPGVLIPTVVRVGSRAATGPHVAGLVAEPQSLIDATLHEPRIGRDLQAIVDGVHQPTRPPASAGAAGGSVTLPAAA